MRPFRTLPFHTILPNGQLQSIPEGFSGNVPCIPNFFRPFSNPFAAAVMLPAAALQDALTGSLLLPLMALLLPRSACSG